MANPPKGLVKVCANAEAMLRKAEGETGIALSAQQKEAVRVALRSGVSIITGGPGTGKTTVIRTLLSMLEGGGLKTAVAAPTGRAAKRIMETSGHYACTIHRLLEYYYDEMASGMAFGRNVLQPLEYQAVIIDEASMMDLMLAEALCDALQPGTRLIFELVIQKRAGTADDILEQAVEAHGGVKGEQEIFADLLIPAPVHGNEQQNSEGLLAQEGEHQHDLIHHGAA